jgi:plasmid stability protein
MATLVIKNLPEPLHRKLKERAERNHRSLTKEAVALIEAAVAGTSPTTGTAAAQDALSALIAAGEELARQGVDVRAWAQRSREVWR